MGFLWLARSFVPGLVILQLVDGIDVSRRVPVVLVVVREILLSCIRVDGRKVLINDWRDGSLGRGFRVLGWRRKRGIVLLADAEQGKGELTIARNAFEEGTVEGGGVSWSTRFISLVGLSVQKRHDQAFRTSKNGYRSPSGLTSTYFCTCSMSIQLGYFVVNQIQPLVM